MTAVPGSRGGRDGSPPVPGPGDARLLAFLCALADSPRQRLLESLAGRELTAAGCAERLGIPAGELIGPLSDLVRRGCVGLRRIGGVNHYRIRDPRIEELLSLSRALALDRSDRLGTCGQASGAS
ncbi:MAG TPA: helix-turn-helix domain-containing protein [Streptosporangiaceae bacterium]